MSKNNRNFIDDMVDMFGYDYVIGHCLCSEYDLRNKADREEDDGKKRRYLKIAQMYKKKAEALTMERINNDL